MALFKHNALLYLYTPHVYYSGLNHKVTCIPKTSGGNSQHMHQYSTPGTSRPSPTDSLLQNYRRYKLLPFISQNTAQNRRSSYTSRYTAAKLSISSLCKNLLVSSFLLKHNCFVQRPFPRVSSRPWLDSPRYCISNVFTYD